MASPTTTDKVRSNFLFQVWDHDPGGTSATVVSPDGGTTLRYVDMRDYSDFAVIAAPTVVNDDLTKIEIVASADTAFSAVTVIKDSGTIAADAIGDWAIQACTAAEVAQEGADAGVDLRYVAGRITHANGSDESLVVYFAIPNNPKLNRTAATTIA